MSAIRLRQLAASSKLLHRLRRAQPFVAMGSAIWSRLSFFLVLALAARLLPPEEFDIFSILQLAYGIVVALVSGGDMWLNRFTRHVSGPRFLTLAQGIYLLTALATAAFLLSLGLLVTFFWPDIDRHQATALWGLLAGILGGLAEVCFAIVRSHRRVFSFFLLRDFVVSASILAVLKLTHPAHAAGVFVIFCGVSLAAIIVLLATSDSLSALRRAMDYLRTRRGSRLGYLSIRHSLSAQFGNILSRLAYLDVFVLSRVLPVGQTGEYRVAAQLALGFVVVQHYIFLSLPWQLRAAGRSRGQGSGGKQVAQHQYLLLLLSGLAFIVLVVAARPILLIYGARFTDYVWIFRAMLAVRLAGLLWGPQHEVLVSSGRMWADAQTNLAILVVWPIAFIAAQQITAPLQAAVIATALADTAVQGVRNVILHQAGIHVSRGHPFGALLPCALTVGIILFVLLIPVV